MGFTDFRVRQADGHARIEVPEDQMEALFAKREEILRELKPLYKTVSLNLEARK